MTAANVIPFEIPRKTARTVRPASAESPAPHERRSSRTPFPAFEGNVEQTADLLLAMETHPLTEPVVWVVQCADRRSRVAVRLGTAIASAVLDPRDARFTADILFHEQAFPGCLSVAERLNDAADRADSRNGLPLARAPRRYRSSHGAVIGIALLLAAVFAGTLIDTAARWLGH